MMVEHGGEPHPSLRMVPCVIWRGTELVRMGNRLMGEERRFVMMRLVKLSMMGEMFVMVEVIELFMMLDKAPSSKRCHAQCSEENATRRSSNPSSNNGTCMQDTTVGWMMGSSDSSC